MPNDQTPDDPAYLPGGLFGPPHEPWLERDVERGPQRDMFERLVKEADTVPEPGTTRKPYRDNLIAIAVAKGFRRDWVEKAMEDLLADTPEERQNWLKSMDTQCRTIWTVKDGASMDEIKAVMQGGLGIFGAWQRTREEKLARAFNPFLRAAAPSFDPEAWPVTVRNYARQQNERSGIDANAIAFGALFSAAMAIHPKSRIALRPEGNWHEPPALWVGLFADSGANKSYAHRDVKRHANAREARERQRFAEAATKIEKEFEDIEKPTKAQEKAKEKALAAITPIRAYAPDGTPEAMQDIMQRPAQKGWGLAVISDEMLGSLKSIEYNRNGRHFLAGYDCAENYNIDRVGRGNFTIPIWSLGMFGGLQIERMLTSRENYASDGMLQRFIPIIMAKAARVDPAKLAKYKGTPVTSDDAAITKAIETSYGRDAAIFALTDEARDIFDVHENYALDVAEGLGETSFRSFVDKMRGTWGRIAAAMHILEGKDPATPISGTTATRTTRLMEKTIWQHGDMLYSLLDEGRADEARQEAAEVLLRLESNGKRVVTVSDLTHAGRAWRFKDARDRDRMLDLFMAGGWVEEINTTQMMTRTRQFEILEGLAARFDAELQAYWARVHAALTAIRNATGWDVKTPGWADGKPEDGA